MTHVINDKGSLMFKTVSHVFQLSAVSGLVKKLLEQQASTGLFAIDPATLSAKLVASISKQGRDLLDGSRGPSPHKISIAAISLAQGMIDFAEGGDDYSACHLSLGTILMELEQNAGLYSFNDKDRAFIELSKRQYLSWKPTLEWPEYVGPSVARASVAFENADDPITIEPKPDLDQRRANLDARLKTFKLGK